MLADTDKTPNETPGSDWLSVIDAKGISLTQRIASVGVLGMLIISLLTFVDVTLRYFFNSPITGFNEIVEVTMAVAIAATFSAGAAQRIHLNVDFLGRWLGPSLRSWLKAAGNFLLLVFFIMLAWRIGEHAHVMQNRSQVLQLLDWPVAPFMWTVSILMALAVPAQFIVVVIDLRNALLGLGTTDTTHGIGEVAEQSHQKHTGHLSGLAVAGLIIALVIFTTATIIYLKPIVASFATILPAGGSALGVALFLVMWVLILLLVPLAAAMGLIGLVGAVFIVGFEPALSAFGTQAEEFITNINLAVLPLFLMMGSFATVAGLSGDIYNLAHVLLGHRRGGLGYATIGGCAGFGALTGSSLATAVTIGRVALPEMRERGYAPDLATGCVAAGGTLGQLVPPSAPIVIYALLVEESIGRLFIAAMIPALIAVALYMATIFIYVRVANKAAPATERPTWAEVFTAAKRSWGVVFLFALVIGGIYGGVFTVNEAAAIGAGGAFLFALFRGKLGGGAFWRVMGETTQTTAMIYALILGAVIFSFFMGITGLPAMVAQVITELNLPALGVIALLLIIYLLLGAIMDPFAMMVITVPIVAPIILDLGYDLIWWGIIMVAVVETGLITPPFGINVFVLKGVAPDVPLLTIFRGVMPFVVADIVKLILLVLFPALVLWLPSTMIN